MEGIGAKGWRVVIDAARIMDAQPVSTVTGTLRSVLVLVKPGIAVGVAAAGYAGMVMARRGLPMAGVAVPCILAILLASAGAGAGNVLIEAESDALMPRVADRARALERIGMGNAALFSASLVAAALLISAAFLGIVASCLTLVAVAGYIYIYTVHLKRRSPYGMVLGGIPGALPVLIGYTSVRPTPGLDGVILFVVMLLWQPPHFLALALSHKGEYAKAGLPVMPVVCGERYTKAFMLIYAAALPPLTLSLWALGYCSAWFAVFAFAAGSLFALECLIDVVYKEEYGRAFTASIVYIMAIQLGVVVDVWARQAGIILRLW